MRRETGAAVTAVESPAGRQSFETPPPVPSASHQAAPDAASAERRPARRRRNRRRGQGAVAQPANAAVVAEPAGPLPEAFQALGIDEEGLRAVAALGFDQPTEIQERTIPLLLEGRDVVGLAQTGTGKTLAFGLPLVRALDPADPRVQAIVLVPTRELAAQVHEVMVHLARYRGLAAVSLLGGRRLTTDFVALEKGAHIVVGTPGRVLDHLERGTLSLQAVRFAVLDEADEMLDIGFARDIARILRSTPRNRQTALFSATMPPPIRRLVYSYMEDPVHVAVAEEQRTAEGVRHVYCEVAERDKFGALCHFHRTMDLGRTLVFRRTKQGVDRLTAQLRAAGIPAKAIHGDLRQNERDRVMAQFRSGELEVLVATNVASRGLDIPDIEHVINYDLPQNSEEYIHRIGRTARAGKTGTAITFVGEWDLDGWDVLRSEVGAVEFEHAEYHPARPARRGEPVQASA